MKLDEFLAQAWPRYVDLTPDADPIHRMLEARGERVVNDHVAFRTFNLPGISRHDIGRVFEGWGYRAVEDLEFPEKKLLAMYWVHDDAFKPKIFVSELLLERCSAELQAWVRTLAAQARPVRGPADLMERSWAPVRYADYERFYAESEYAAWTAAFGIQVNHFTVLVNELKTFDSLQALNAELIAQGFKLNSAGGVVKGSAAEFLEQSSTMAQKVWVEFVEGTRQIAGCYYEFARRYEVPGTGKLFIGFVPKSADKIFESTSERR